MQFVLTQVVARLVAAYLFVDCWQTLHSAFAEGKITDRRRDLIVWLLNPTTDVVSKVAAPVRYWILIGLEIGSLVGCAIVAILGWWLPNA